MKNTPDQNLEITTAALLFLGLFASRLGKVKKSVLNDLAEHDVVLAALPLITYDTLPAYFLPRLYKGRAIAEKVLGYIQDVPASAETDRIELRNNLDTAFDIMVFLGKEYDIPLLVIIDTELETIEEHTKQFDEWCDVPGGINNMYDTIIHAYMINLKSFEARMKAFLLTKING